MSMFENIYGFFRDLDKSSGGKKLNFGSLINELNLWCLFLDPRVNDLFLMGSSWSVTIVVVAYLYFVLKAAPKWMEHQKPFDLTKIINAYNILQMAANLYAFVFVRTLNLVHQMTLKSFFLDNLLFAATRGFPFLLPTWSTTWNFAHFIETSLQLLRIFSSQSSGFMWHGWRHLDRLSAEIINVFESGLEFFLKNSQKSFLTTQAKQKNS